MDTRIARGSWQSRVLLDLMCGGCVNPITALRGKANNYRVHYVHSFSALLARLRAHGWRIEIDPGTRGGLYSATYRAVKVDGAETLAATVRGTVDRLGLPATVDDHGQDGIVCHCYGILNRTYHDRAMAALYAALSALGNRLERLSLSNGQYAIVVRPSDYDPNRDTRRPTSGEPLPSLDTFDCVTCGTIPVADICRQCRDTNEYMRTLDSLDTVPTVVCTQCGRQETQETVYGSLVECLDCYRARNARSTLGDHE